MSSLETTNLVAQRNTLIESRQNFSTKEKLLLLAMISMINPEDAEFGTFLLTVERLKDVMKLNKKTSNLEIKRTISGLMGRVAEVKTPRGWMLRQWVSHADLKDNIITLRFHDDLKPYLLQLKKEGNFTQFRVADVIKFKSAYTLRMYELLQEYSSKRMFIFEFSLKEFRQIMLGSKPTKYPNFREFRRNVITVAQKGLGEKNKAGLFKSCLNFDVETRRTGRKISHLIFTIKSQQTKPVQSGIKPRENDTAPQIIRDYEAIGIMRQMVQPYLDQRGEQAIKNTLNKFYDDKEAGKITKSEQGYLAYLLRVNAGQETTQDKERQQKKQNEKQLKEKAAQEQALKAQFEQERDDALNAFFDGLIEDEIDYIKIDFEASELFKKRIEGDILLNDMYKNGIDDYELKRYFHSFIVENHLDKTLNNFPKWKELKEKASA